MKRKKRVKKSRMIVKLQIQLAPDPGSRVLIYNEDRSIFYEQEATEELRAILFDRLKRYLYAHLEGTILNLDEDAPDQDW
jgi:hypothetical protein